MTAPRAAAAHTIPTGSLLAARERGGCNGEGLVVIRTEDGPDVTTCPGCRHCTPTTARPAAEVAAAARAATARVFCAALNDDAF